MLFHTPHLADKYQGTRMILDLLRADSRIDRSRMCVDHCEEHTIRMGWIDGDTGRESLCIRRPRQRPSEQRTWWRCTAPNASGELVGRLGSFRSACRAAGSWLAMRRRDHPEPLVRQIVYDNPLIFLNQSVHFAFSFPT